jgi:ubiquinone/menaquinone biosynthesis C-methylase UbiE
MNSQQATLASEPCNHSVCTWWKAYFFDNWLRRLIHDPSKIVGPYLKKDMHVLDLGCGMGFFSLAMAKMVGENGSVTSVDLQEEMLSVLSKRARKRGLGESIRTHRCNSKSLDISTQADFALACWMVHEVPNIPAFFQDVYEQLKPGARFLVLEPKGHLSAKEFEQQKQAARDAGFTVEEGLKVAMSYSMLLTKSKLRRI